MNEKAESQLYLWLSEAIRLYLRLLGGSIHVMNPDLLIYRLA